MWFKDRNGEVINEGFYTDGHHVYYLKAIDQELVVETDEGKTFNLPIISDLPKGLVRVLSSGSAKRAAEFILRKYQDE